MPAVASHHWCLAVLLFLSPALAWGQTNFLRNPQFPDGRWRYGGPEVPPDDPRHLGATALAALGLLDAGVSPDDPVIVKARELVLEHKAEVTSTLHMAAGILLLHRLEKLPSSLVGKVGYQLLMQNSKRAKESEQYETKLHDWAKKLMDGQERLFGGWGPSCPSAPSSVDLFHTQMALVALGVAKHHRVDVLNSQKRVVSAWRWPMHYGSPVLEPDRPGFTFALWLYRWHLEVGHLRDWPTLNRDFAWRIVFSHMEKDGAWRRDLRHGAVVETVFALGVLNQIRKRPKLPTELALLSTSLRLRDYYEQAVAMQPPQPPAAAPAPAAPVRAPRRQPPAQVLREGKPGEEKALREELRTAMGERFDATLDLMEKTRGSEYTQALSEAIPTLPADKQDRGRIALQNRLSRMSLKTLESYLAVENKELQRAAIMSIPGKLEAEDTIPQLIPFLSNKDKILADSAHQALKKLSGKDFGHDAKAWTKWWEAGRQ